MFYFSQTSQKIIIYIKNKTTKEYILIKHTSHYYFFSFFPDSPIKPKHSNSFNLSSMNPLLASTPGKKTKHEKHRTVTVLVQEYHRGGGKEEKYMYNSAVSDLRPAPLPSAFTGVTAA